VIGDGLGVLDGTAALQVGGDAGRPEGMVAASRTAAEILD
jgi:hypothetical protein